MKTNCLAPIAVAALCMLTVFASCSKEDDVIEIVPQRTWKKLFVCAEPCYGEAVIRAVDGVNGVLAMSGASASEQSWADNWSNDANVWMSDRFSQSMVNCLTDKPETSFRDLYLYCAQHTLGSHAKVVGAAGFGNLYLEGPAEFIKYK